MRWTVPLILLFGSLQGISQQFSFKGVVVDAYTNEPLAFSTINVLGTSQGVVSNFLGEFEFSVDSNQDHDSLYVSMLGYKPFKGPLTSFTNSDHYTIRLEENVVMLTEVEVNEEELTAQDIVVKVLENISNNYPTEPYILSGFTRSHKHECGKYVTLFEAAFSVYGQGYHKKTPERIYVSQSRQSQHVPYYHSRVLRNNRNLFISMRHINDVLFRSYALKIGNNQYEVDKYIVEDGELIYVIKTVHSKYVQHTLYVKASDYALLKVKMEMDTPAEEDWNPLLNRGPSSDSLDFKVTRISKTIQFEKTEERYHAKYMDWLVEGNLSEQETSSSICDWGFRFETMFDQVVMNPPQKPSKEYLMNPKSKKDPPSIPYKQEFWENYPPLKEFPITPKIVTDLEADSAPLHQQFKASGQ